MTTMYGGSNLSKVLGDIDRTIEALPKYTLEGEFTNDVPYAFFWNQGFMNYEAIRMLSIGESKARNQIAKDLGSWVKQSKRVLVSEARIKKIFDKALRMGMSAARAASPGGRTKVLKRGGVTRRVYKVGHVGGKDGSKNRAGYNGTPVIYPSQTPMNSFHGWRVSEMTPKSGIEAP